MSGTITLEEAARREIVTIGKRLYARGLVSGTDGNMSIRLGSNRFLITPSRVSKGFLSTASLIVVDESGNVLEGTGRPSSEIKMHLTVYGLREDISAVLHAHPPLLTAMTLAQIPFNAATLPEIWLAVGEVPTVRYATPSTDELPHSILPFITRHRALLLERHGSLTCGETLEEAYFLLEKLEHGALVTLASLLFAGKLPTPLSSDEREKLSRAFRALSPYGGIARHEGKDISDR